MDLVENNAEDKAKELEEQHAESPYGDINTKPSKKGARMLAAAIPGVANTENYVVDDQEEAGDEGEEELEGQEGEEDAPEGDIEDGEEQEDGEEGESSNPVDYSALTKSLKEVYGEEELETPEQIEAAINRIVDERNGLEKERETFEAVTSLFDEDDSIVQIAKYRKEGYSINEAIARTIDFNEWQEELKENDPEEYKKVVKRQMEREQAQKEAEKARKEHQEQIQANQKESSDHWRGFVEDHFKTETEDGKEVINEDAAKKFSEQINSHFQNVADGKVTPEFLDVMYRGLNYDKDVKKAEEKGKVEGANKAIKDKTAKTKGDGTPDLKRGGPRKQPKSASYGKKAVADAVGRNSSGSDWR